MTQTPDVHHLLSLSGETVLVTGASGNIGRGIARRLAEAGASIIIHYHRDEASATTLAEEIGTDRVVGARLDDASEVDAIFRKYEPTLVVNNAAAQPVRTLADMSFDDWRSVLSTNLDGPFLVVQRAARSSISPQSKARTPRRGMPTMQRARPHC
jgi:NAD(P)-dependent dehydrogenase (short-subunit alcohol dehydrogenase family)